MQVLKFVLWTWPSAGADNAGFQNDRIKFHQILAHTKVHGFLGSGIFKVDTAPFAGSFLFENSPWLGGHKTVLEEWYVFHGSAALDAINEAVIAGPYKAGHAKFLRQDLGGECAGLYYMRNGTVDQAVAGITETDSTVWIHKTYATYDELAQRLEPSMRSSGSVLWRRLLVLGATHEMHLDVKSSVNLPEDLKPGACWVKRTRIWPISEDGRRK
jgi:hypothetical protein